MSEFIWLNNSHNVRTKFELARILRWTSITASVILVGFIMNYVNELRLLKIEKAEAGRQTSFPGLMVLTGITALAATLVVGTQFLHESLDIAGYLNKVTESARRLAEPFEARTYVSNPGDTLRYRLMKPIDYDPKKKYPLVVCLHHGGAHGTDNITQINCLSLYVFNFTENLDHENSTAFQSTRYAKSVGALH